jgi:Protein of unknown function (DUF3606)
MQFSMVWHERSYIIGFLGKQRRCVMMDIRKPQDVNRVNVSEREEVRWWCSQLSCNEMRLKNAVKAVGPSVEAVKKYLHR